MDIKRTKNIIEGFEDDFAGIVEDFPKTSSNLRLVDFLQYWTDKSMDCLFANRFDPRELLEAISEMNQILVQIATNSYSQNNHQEVIALYFMLCLYVKQPIRLRRKIRLSCDDVIRIQDLSSFSSDTSFVWRQLRIMQAIDFVEERDVYGPSMLLNRGMKVTDLDVAQKDLITENQKDTKIFLHNKIDPTLLETEGICAPYEQIKDTLKLDDYTDETVEVQTNGTIREFLDQAKTLLFEFKAREGSQVQRPVI